MILGESSSDSRALPGYNRSGSTEERFDGHLFLKGVKSFQAPGTRTVMLSKEDVLVAAASVEDSLMCGTHKDG